MIFKLKNIKGRQAYNIQTIVSLHNIPQVPVWENLARQFFEKRAYPEACFVLDVLAKHYGKQVGRTCAERVLGIPMHARGKGMTAGCPQTAHPTIYALRDGLAPLAINDRFILRCGAGIRCVSPASDKVQTFHALSKSPSTAIMMNVDNRHIQWLCLDHLLVFADGSDTIMFVDIENTPTGDVVPLHCASLSFETPIRGISGPLNDGTILVTRESPIPILSDICTLISLDTAKIHDFLADNITADIRQIEAIRSENVLTNIEQSLHGDCLPTDSFFMTCAGGMQNREVRFIYADGSWTTRFIHEAPVLRIIPSDRGPVSIDETGQAFLWQDQNVVDDIKFDLAMLPDAMRNDMEQLDFTIDWAHQRLYLTETDECSSLSDALKASRSCCLTPTSADPDAFIKKIYHLPNATIAMLADGNLHFWDIVNDCVDMRWQLPQICADSSEWRTILDTRSPAIEDDPRVRIIDLSMR